MAVAGRWLGLVFRQDTKKPALKRAFLIGTYLSRANKNRGFYGGQRDLPAIVNIWCIQPESNRHDQRSRDFKSLASTNSAMDAAGDDGGSGEIRTHGWVTPSPVFKTGPFNRSGTLPIPWAFSRHALRVKSTTARKALKCNV